MSLPLLGEERAGWAQAAPVWGTREAGTPSSIGEGVGGHTELASGRVSTYQVLHTGLSSLGLEEYLLLTY